MPQENRNILVFEDAKAFLPLKSECLALGFQLLPARELGTLANLDRVVAYFACFYRCLDHPLAAWKRRSTLARAGVPVVAWNRDAPHYLNRPKWRLRLASTLRLVDIYASHTLIDPRRFADTQLYFPNAADVNTYTVGPDAEATLARLRDPGNYRYDVSFFGGMDGRRYKEDAERERFFTALGERLTERGIRFLFREAAGMSVAQQIELIQSSRINLNFGARCEYRAPTASGLPERCYGIPACGGFLLCDRRTHARDDFTVGENWAEFDGLDDGLAQIEYWLAHFDRARDLAERCHRHVMRHHNYAHRAQSLHQALLAWHCVARQHPKARCA